LGFHFFPLAENNLKNRIEFGCGTPPGWWYCCGFILFV
jgi:hypothetical protein